MRKDLREIGQNRMVLLPMILVPMLILVVLLGTISTLLYFRFSAKRMPSGKPDRSKLLEGFAYLGRLFISVTFGVMYAGALIATLVILTERIQFLWDVVSMFLKG